MKAGGIYHWLVGALVFLAVVAAFSRVITMPQAGKYVADGFKALIRLFNGAFGL